MSYTYEQILWIGGINIAYELIPVSKEHMQTLHDWDSIEQHRELYTCRPVNAVVLVEQYNENLQKKIHDGVLKVFVIVSKKNRNLPLGRIVLFDFNKRNKSAEFGYYLPLKFRGQGLGKLMLSLFLDLVFKLTDLNKVYATTSSNNERSVKLLKSFSFNLDGRLREHYWVGEERFDQLNYSILRREWNNRIE